MKKKVTLNFDSRVYEKFKRFCDDNAIRLSRRIELEMLKILKERGGK